jgi:hypothetical protein
MHGIVVYVLNMLKTTYKPHTHFNARWLSGGCEIVSIGLYMSNFHFVEVLQLNTEKRLTRHN